MFNKFWEMHTSPSSAVEVCLCLSVCLFVIVMWYLYQKARGGAMLDGIVKVAKMLNSRPHSWMDCVALARVKFEKYFNHRVCA